MNLKDYEFLMFSFGFNFLEGKEDCSSLLYVFPPKLHTLFWCSTTYHTIGFKMGKRIKDDFIKSNISFILVTCHNYKD